MSRIPCSSQKARSSRRKAGGAGVKPPSPWTGSMSTHATEDAGMSVEVSVRRSAIAPATAAASSPPNPRYTAGNVERCTPGSSGSYPVR